MIKWKQEFRNLRSRFRFLEWLNGSGLNSRFLVLPGSLSIFTPDYWAQMFYAGSRINVRPLSQQLLSQTHISKSEFKNGHISGFCSVFQVIQVISSAKFFSAEEVDLSFNSETKEHSQISNPSFWKRDSENVFLQMFWFGEKWIHSTNTK